MKQLLGLAVVGSALLGASPAEAHVSLMEPVARYDGSVANQSKACPCGVGQSNRLCNVDGDRSDPDRSNNVTTLEAGSTVTMVFDEYIGHTGRYRIAFDPDGADYADFNENVLADWVDPAGMDGNSGNGSIWEMEFVVPTTPCSNCTLQLIQRMDGDTVNPVGETIGLSSYYQCADVVIVPPGGMPPDMGTDPVDMGTDPDPSPDTGTTPGPGPGPGPGPTGDLGTNPGPGPGGGDDGGLANVNATGSCATAAGTPSTLTLLFAGFVAVRRRKRL